MLPHKGEGTSGYGSRLLSLSFCHEARPFYSLPLVGRVRGGGEPADGLNHLIHIAFSNFDFSCHVVRTESLQPQTNGHAHPRGRLTHTGWSLVMSIKTKIAAVALAALTLTGGMAATSQPAQARGLGLGLGIAAGVIGAAAVGAAVANGGYLL